MLYVCATPIGNLKDISLRALEVLAYADIILCEDTRVSQQLLNHHNILAKRLVSLHEHNENQVSMRVIEWLRDGLTIVQLSDAGTPGISDPGSRLCKSVREQGFLVSPIPGCCAYTSLLSVSGIATPSLFYGFLPATTTKRSKVLLQWQDVDYTVCIYEAPHRIVACINDIVKTLGSERVVIMGRELTKKFETIKELPAEALLAFISNDPNQQRGEFTLLIKPNIINQNDNALTTSSPTTQQLNILNLLAQELPPKKAASITATITGANKNLLYNHLVRQSN